MAHFYLNTYQPLVGSAAGRAAQELHGLPPFIDGSIRREPDLEHDYPSISCLCRAGKFAPRLQVDDVVAYVTRKAGKRPRRLSAILQVVHTFPNHREAASWYRSQGLALPSNCMVTDNPPQPLDKSHRIHKWKHLPDNNAHRAWDASYSKRAKKHPQFVICRTRYRELSEQAPEVSDETLLEVFGCIPGTQNPGAHPMAYLQHFAQALGVRLRK